eukprot:scpid85310/ scgid6014/ 
MASPRHHRLRRRSSLPENVLLATPPADKPRHGSSSLEVKASTVAGQHEKNGVPLTRTGSLRLKVEEPELPVCNVGYVNMDTCPVAADQHHTVKPDNLERVHPLVESPSKSRNQLTRRATLSSLANRIGGLTWLLQLDFAAAGLCSWVLQYCRVVLMGITVLMHTTMMCSTHSVCVC